MLFLRQTRDGINSQSGKGILIRNWNFYDDFFFAFLLLLSLNFIIQSSRLYEKFRRHIMMMLKFSSPLAQISAFHNFNLANLHHSPHSRKTGIEYADEVDEKIKIHYHIDGFEINKKKFLFRRNETITKRKKKVHQIKLFDTCKGSSFHGWPELSQKIIFSFFKIWNLCRSHSHIHLISSFFHHYHITKGNA